ncbi:MAG TPA: TonB-dependent receptor [Mucilaginibacter sp.]|jgi:TonB-linked SusC/RagA family outer membrane protein
MISRLQIKNFVALIGVSLSLVLISFSGFAQNNVVTGTVTDEGGVPLPGVTVKVKGTTTATVTTVSGNYSIKTAAKSTLVFSFVGFTTQEIAANGGSAVNVKLTTDAKSLSEIVVIGYGTAKRSDLTGAISSVTAKQIEDVPVTSLDQALQGRAAGVQVTSNDGAPGGNVTVLIRGTGSLASYGNGPLYVVDGYPMDAGGINNINPNDIATIDVLKDASATAIYGIRAANGVVLVSTKKGKKGSTQVFVDARFSIQDKPKEYQVLNADQFATMSNLVATDPSQNFQTNPAWSNPASLHNVDWQNAVYRAGYTQDYNFGIRGGSDKVQSATSFGYYDQKGIVYGSYFKRATFATNVDYQPQNWLKSSTNVKYTYQDGRNPYGTGNLLNLAALVPTLDGGNKYTNQVKQSNGAGGYDYGFYNPTYSRQNGAGGNPITGIDYGHQNNLNYFLLANTALEATVISGLRIKANIGVNTSNFAGVYDAAAYTVIADQYPGQTASVANYSQNINQTFNWLMEYTIAYDKTFGKHTIGLLGGASGQKTIWSGMGGSGIPPNSVIQDLTQVTNLQLYTNNPSNPNTGNGTSITTLQSYFARATYSFDNRYFLTGTVRRDGSSKFPVKNQYGTFPSGSVAWKAKEESFLKNVSWLSDLKFRGSYGQVGNQGAIPAFQYLALYYGNLPSSANGGGIDNLGYPFNKLYQTGLAPSQPANPDLKWETDTQADVGVDASFLNGELTTTIDWYDRKSKDFLLTLASPAQTGYNFLTKNVGSMENKGLEFLVNYNHRASNDLQFGATVTITANQNKLTSVTSGANYVGNFGGLTLPTLQGWSTFSQTYIGQPVGEFYGFKSIGIFQSQAQIDALNAAAVAKYGPGTYYQHSVTKPGDRYFADTNGDGIVNANDQVSLGSPQPKFYGSLNLTSTYKSWDATLYFYGTYGNKIFSFAESNLQSFESRQNVSIENVSQEYYQNAWTPQNHSNIYSRIVANDDAEGSNAASSAFIENGSYLKLKTVNIGYTLPTAIAKKLALAKLRLYVSSQNLFTITSYKGLDPEIGTQGGNATQNGIDNGAYPSSRFFTIGLNVTL